VDRVPWPAVRRPAGTVHLIAVMAANGSARACCARCVFGRICVSVPQSEESPTPPPMHTHCPLRSRLQSAEGVSNTGLLYLADIGIPREVWNHARPGVTRVLLIYFLSLIASKLSTDNSFVVLSNVLALLHVNMTWHRAGAHQNGAEVLPAVWRQVRDTDNSRSGRNSLVSPSS
jgi:hypothetical protein